MSPKIKTAWDLSTLFKSFNDPEIEKSLKKHEIATEKFVKKWGKRTDYLQEPETLKLAIDEYNNWLTNFGNEPDAFFYFSLLSEADQSNPKIKAGYAKALEFAQKISNKMQFFEHRISLIKPSRQGKFLNHPALKKYRHFLKRNFKQAKYLLPEGEEKILNLMHTAAYENWVKMREEFINREELEVLDENKKVKKMPFSKITSLTNSRHKIVRDRAAQAFNQIMEKHSAVAERELNSILYVKKINDELRKMSRPDLSRHLRDDIESETVDSLISSVSQNYQISKDFYKLKSRLLGLKKLKYHERNVPYGKVDKKYSFNEASELANGVFGNLDPEFKEIFEKFLSNGQVDVFPKKAKHSGAFCVYGRINHPDYVLLNFDGSIKEIITIAHEFGHAINDELMKKAQNAVNFGSTLATAETASTFMEDFILQKLLQKVNEKTRLSLIMERLNEEVSTVFRQIACYKFEQNLHQAFRNSNYLTKEDIGKIFQKHMKEYMGPYVEQSQGSQNWWVYWGHIRQPFYVYSYANGLLISKALQQKVKKDPSFINKVKTFLSAGLSASPYEIFKDLGLDINKKEFWLEGINEIKDELNEAEKLAKKLRLI